MKAREMQAQEFTLYSTDALKIKAYSLTLELATNDSPTARIQLELVELELMRRYDEAQPTWEQS